MNFFTIGLVVIVIFCAVMVGLALLPYLLLFFAVASGLFTSM